jgi:hypothetical protein
VECHVFASPLATRPYAAPWLSMSLCVGLLIAAEFLPVSLLTPIAADLHASDGMAGQAISVSGLFAVFASLGGQASCSARSQTGAAHLTTLLLLSVLLTAQAGSFAMLMLARALLGLVIGGFWSLATATVSRLVPAEQTGRSAGHTVYGQCGGRRFCCPCRQLSGRHHRLARGVLGAGSAGAAQPLLAVAQPARPAGRPVKLPQTRWPCCPCAMCATHWPQ